MSTLGNYAQKIPPKPVGKRAHNSEILGIEIELEYCQQPHVKPWQSKEDGSLKINGKEFTLCTYHTAALNHLKTLFEAQEGAEFGERTSVHVHINVLDLTIDNLLVMIYTYTLFEKALYKYSGNRKQNIFCIPINNSLIIPTIMSNYNQFYSWLTSYSESNLKYSGLNYHTLITFGTLEFRHMEGNNNPLYINTWLELIVALKKYAKKTQLLDFISIIKDMSSTSAYNWIVTEVFGTNSSALYYKNFKLDIEEAICNLKLMLIESE